MALREELNKFYFDKSLNELRLMSLQFSSSQITYNSLLYMNIIKNAEKCTSSYIAKVLNVSKSAVTIKVNELLKQGLITKRQSENDKRVFYLEIANDEDHSFESYDKHLTDAVDYIENKFSRPHVDSFVDMLKLLNERYSGQTKE